MSQLRVILGGKNRQAAWPVFNWPCSRQSACHGVIIGKMMKLPRFSVPARHIVPCDGLLPASSLTTSGHCGTSWHEPFVRDRWGDADFSGSCKKHDQCYETCGSSRSSCDSQFERDMETACRDAYPGGGIDYARRSSCIGVANTYSVAVERMGGDAYRAAQRNSGC